VAPGFRRRGIAGGLLAGLLAETPAADLVAEVTLAERDPIDPLDRGLRGEIARRLLARAGFEIGPAASEVRAADALAIHVMRRLR
jgi:hypothetical protein